MQGFTAYLVGFAIVAGFAVALGFIFGIFNQIVAQLNTDPNNPMISQEFVDAINLAQSLGGTGLTLAIAALIVGLAMLLIAVIRSYSGV
ncbi:hypothetical protein ASQ66_gp22 [Aeropyrum pernix spindle-shaped virus 1]|uniref:Uncharacterized protein n=1 Tax=Aeropyrum pernix (strain ATCC 700893 / DSM 11879 / JCM 9820 / NBRC 100138 / K1) TaxID=272557 RepID=Q05E46_AERPE|nr:hypothetical protein [Aeropyrum pernix]YP_009177752.1 hypothetical protein ASQ66_gp22 [Aeropyrum pernix spindle-shaped virus 1]BAF34755.1 hypothetical protein APE_0850a [Aeropyrum pernix spindle-shaped virus 1] [Aeropyrum pernix K1]CCD22110.1 TPA: hypothetical protein [Aeropyrum pernix spindle-shaped virus 1]